MVAALLLSVVAMVGCFGKSKENPLINGVIGEWHLTKSPLLTDDTAEIIDVYIEFKSDKQNLLLNIFDFVAKNYKTDCSLYELAKETTYSYVYLSKLFSKSIGISYTEYVCRFRINEACYLLANTNSSVLDIAYECGFDCLRSFNRSFKSVMGITPSAYKKQFLKG